MPLNTRSGWPMFRRVWRRAELFEIVARLLHINLAKAAGIGGGTAIHEARAKCLRCPRTTECRNWIESSEGLPLPPDFCPNHQFFGRCQATEVAQQDSEWHK